MLELRPGVVIVDDAHEDLRRLKDLRQLRQDIELEFDIVAMCWNGERDTVAEELGSLPADRVRRLELLTADQVVEIFHQAGLRASDEVLRHLRI